MVKRGSSGGFWSVINGLDGCAMVPFLAFLLMPTAIGVLFVWVIRDGLARAFNPVFTQWTIIGIGVILLLAVTWGPLALILAAWAHARRPPATPVPPAPAFNVKMMGGIGAEIQQGRGVLPAPQSLPPGAIPVILEDRGGI